MYDLSTLTEAELINLAKWRKILDVSDIVGGDLETVEGHACFRGPIANIYMNSSGMIYIEYVWCAWLGPDTQGWEIYDSDGISLNGLLITPTSISDDRIVFFMPALGNGTIFPKGCSNLDPSRVRGLDLSTLTNK